MSVDQEAERRTAVLAEIQVEIDAAEALAKRIDDPAYRWAVDVLWVNSHAEHYGFGIPDAMDALHNKLAAEFARRRGWKLSRDPHSARRLYGPVIDRCGFGWFDNPPCYDHPYSFNRDRRPVALTIQPYNVDANYRRDMVAWAQRKQLRIEFPADFPSWHYPGKTTLVVFSR
jgi:hypothetical protein